MPLEGFGAGSADDPATPAGLPTDGEIDASVGARMRERRVALGISQARLGERLGITFSQVQKYEKGANRIGAGRLYRLSRVLGVPVQYFYEDIDERSPPPSERHRPEAATTVDPAEARRLQEAYGGISDRDARAALLSLALSLADPDPQDGAG